MKIKKLKTAGSKCLKLKMRKSPGVPTKEDASLGTSKPRSKNREEEKVSPEQSQRATTPSKNMASSGANSKASEVGLNSHKER
jgi:hypothetical protein